jgi:hypothetical protein
VEMVRNDGKSLYNVNSFRRPWQQEQEQEQKQKQQQQQQKYVILQINNKEVRLLKICVSELYS